MNIIPYNSLLKPYARELRKNLTMHEKLLWKHIRNKQIQGVKFYRQKIIGNFILDFYSKAPPLAIELDGVQHLTQEYKRNDENRDKYLQSINITTLRFSNVKVEQRIDSVLQIINEAIITLQGSN